MKKDWTKKCTCENFQQNEDCEHIGNKVLEEVGMQVEKLKRDYLMIGDEQSWEEYKKAEMSMQVEDSMGSYHPDCKPDIGCAKHFIKDGDRHDRLEGALTPLGEKLAEIKKKIIEKSTFEPGTSSNGRYQIYKDDLDSIL